jgi:hypothetical protein
MILSRNSMLRNRRLSCLNTSSLRFRGQATSGRQDTGAGAPSDTTGCLEYGSRRHTMALYGRLLIGDLWAADTASTMATGAATSVFMAA